MLKRLLQILRPSTVSATHRVRTYGTDATAWHKAVAASSAGDVIVVDYVVGGVNTFNLPQNTTANLKSGVTFRIDEAVVIRPSANVDGDIFPMNGVSNVKFTLGAKNGLGKNFHAEADGRWIVDLDPAAVPGSTPHTSVSRFVKASNVTFEDACIRLNQSTDKAGNPGPQSSTAAAFPYPGKSTTNVNITLRRCTTINSPAGYGLTQVQAGSKLYFYAIKSIGGIALRVEQDAGSTSDNTIHGLVARGVWGEYGNAALTLQPHSGHADGIDIDTVVSIQCERGMLRGDSGKVTNVLVEGGVNSQIRVGGGSSASVSWVRGLSKVVLDGTSGIMPTRVRAQGKFATSNKYPVTSTLPWNPDALFNATKTL